MPRTNQNDMISFASMTTDATIAQIVSANPQAGYLLASIGVRIPVYGGETLEAVCRRYQWCSKEVLEWVKENSLSGYGRLDEASEDPKEDIWKLCNKLPGRYHKRLLELLLDISEDLINYQQLQDDQYARSDDLLKWFDTFEEKLQFYIYFECKRFFPLIRRLNVNDDYILDDTIQKLKRGMKIISDDQDKVLRFINKLETFASDFNRYAQKNVGFHKLNSDLKVLCSLLKEQFGIEQRTILPLIKQRIENL